jgi:Mechanosensitive ion channel
MAKVRAKTRPWRAIFALALAVIAAAVSAYARHVQSESAAARANELLGALGGTGNLLLADGAAVAFLLLAAFATVGLGNKARDVLQPSVGSSHAAVIRFAVLLIAGLLTIVFTMELFAIPITQLVVGGALTGVLVGIAAQQSLANVFAGIVLLLARPFRIGDQIGIRSGALSGLIEGTVAEVSVTYVRLDTANGPVHVPNSQVLAAAVGPVGAVPSPLGPPPPLPGEAAGSEAARDGQPARHGHQPARHEHNHQAAPQPGQEVSQAGQEAPQAGQAAAPAPQAAAPIALGAVSVPRAPGTTQDQESAGISGESPHNP